MPVFPSEDWFAAFVEEINASEEYRDAARNWEGDVSLVFEAEPDKGVPAALYMMVTKGLIGAASGHDAWERESLGRAARTHAAR